MHPSDLKSLLTPMWDEETKYRDSQVVSTRMDTDANDEAVLDFEKKIQERMDSHIGSSMRKQTARRPEEVNFRTAEEEKAAAKLQQRQVRKDSDEKRVNVDSFEFLGMIGEGAFGKVFMAKKKNTNKFYAIKMIGKQKIMQAGKQQEVFRERNALITLDHPNIVKMYWSFDVNLTFLSF